MKTARRISVLCLSLLLLFSFMFSSCKKEEPAPDDEPAWRYLEIVQPVLYFEWAGTYRFRGDRIYDAPSYDEPEGILVSEENPLYDSESDVIERPIDKICIYVSPEVNAYVEEGGVERRFLIRPMGYQHIYTDAERRDAFFKDWCDAILPEEGLGEVVPQIGFISWWGTDADLEKLGKYELDFLVCFYEEFPDIYGMSIEKAQELIAAGELDIWSCPVKDSPMYGRSSAEIAAYLAKQETE